MTIDKYVRTGPAHLQSELPSGRIGNYKLYYWRYGENEYYVLEMGEITPDSNPLVRISSACSIGHIFNSVRCDCRAQLDSALAMIEEDGRGLLIYAFNHEGRGVGIENHVRAYMEQDRGKDTVSSYEVLGLPVDNRDYTDIVKILNNYDLKQMRLLTNNPAKVKPIIGCGIGVTRVPLIPVLNEYNKSQITIKVQKLGHFCDILEGRNSPSPQ